MSNNLVTPLKFLAIIAMIFTCFGFTSEEKKPTPKSGAAPWTTYDTDEDVYVDFPSIRFFAINGTKLTPEGVNVLTKFQSWAHESFQSPHLKILAMSGEVPTRQFWWINTRLDANQVKEMESRATAISAFLRQGMPDGDVTVADRERQMVASEKIDLLAFAESRAKQSSPHQVLIIVEGVKR